MFFFAKAGDSQKYLWVCCWKHFSGFWRQINLWWKEAHRLSNIFIWRWMIKKSRARFIVAAELSESSLATKRKKNTKRWMHDFREGWSLQNLCWYFLFSTRSPRRPRSMPPLQTQQNRPNVLSKVYWSKMPSSVSRLPNGPGDRWGCVTTRLLAGHSLVTSQSWTTVALSLYFLLSGSTTELTKKGTKQLASHYESVFVVKKFAVRRVSQCMQLLAATAWPASYTLSLRSVSCVDYQWPWRDVWCSKLIRRHFLLPWKLAFVYNYYYACAQRDTAVDCNNSNTNRRLR